MLLKKFKNILSKNRYYLLSTAISSDDEIKKITKIIGNDLAEEHGCQVIVNGILTPPNII